MQVQASTDLRNDCGCVCMCVFSSGGEQGHCDSGRLRGSHVCQILCVIPLTAVCTPGLMKINESQSRFRLRNTTRCLVSLGINIDLKKWCCEALGVSDGAGLLSSSVTSIRLY